MTPDRRRWCLAALGLGLCLVATAAPAQDRLELTSGVQQSLLYLQEQWVQWLAAFEQGDGERADELVDDLLVTTDQLGMEALPDPATAALARAVTAARAGDDGRARIGLRAAERLDPGRPENAFARATVERLRGAWPAAVAASLQGHLSRLRLPRERRLWFYDLGVGTLYALLLAGGLFVALSMIVSGPRLYRDLAAFLPSALPDWGLAPLVLLLLLWPLVLPAGVAWLMLYASILLWSYGSRSERAVFVLLWLVAGLTPLAVAQLRERVALETSPPILALDEVVNGRLYGALFSDLGLLTSLLPDEPAVDHLLADVHRQLGQWERARVLYRRVLEEEPRNAAALVDLGAYFFYKRDLGSARRQFQEATSVEPDNALAYFNLNQTFLQSLLYDEASAALQRAQQLAGPQMRRWMDDTEEGALLTADGGLGRRGEIRDRLVAVMEEQGGERVELLRQAWSLLVVFGFAMAALLFSAVRRRWGGGGPGGAGPEFGDGRWMRLAVPGLASLRDGNGAAAFLALLVTVVLLMILLAGRLGFSTPLDYAAGRGVEVLAAGGLVLFFAARSWWIWREEG